MSQSGAGRKPWEMVDVLILTALQDEYDAVLQEDVDALPGSSWERRMGPLGLEVALRTFRGQGGGTLRVAVTRILENGGVAPAYAAAPLVRVFSPRCLAAGGVCASRQDVPYRLIMKETVDWEAPAWAAKARPPAAWLAAGGVLAFLRAHLPPMQLPHRPVQGSERELEALLGPGTEEPPRERGPLAVLNARHAFVDFFEPIHAEVLQDLRSWCEEEESVSVRLFHGAAGSGKTRLFIEVAQRLRSQGWQAGFLHEAVEPDRFEELLASASERPTLVVIDRAESLPQLGALLLSVAHRRKAGGPGRFRLVLLAREAGGWWELLQRRSLELRKLLKERLPTEVAGVSPALREAVFGHAAQRFAALLGRPAPTAPVALTDPRFDRVLTLHMAALATVLGRSATPASLMEEPLDAEGALAGERPSQRLEAWHREPALLGEALALRTLRREGAAAGEWLKRSLEDASPSATRAAFEVLGRLSAEAPEAGEWIASVLAGAVGARAVPALEAAKAIGQRPAFAALGRELAKALEREGSPQVAELLEASGLPEFVPTLREVSVWVKTTLLNHLPPGETPRALIEQARFRGGLGSLLGTLGRRQEAVGFVKEAVALYRKLAEFSPEVFRVDLALGLTDLGVVQGELGQREEALSAMQEAVAIRRALAEESPREFLPILAVNLNGLAGAQSALGRREEALAAMQEAMSHYRTLAKTRPESFLPELAASLNNLGSMQSALGRKAESQASIHEAVGHYRTLAKKHPESYLPELAGSLTNLAIVQGELGRREEALALAQESVALFRQLMEARIEEHLPQFAASLTSLASALSALGRRDEALAFMLESVALRRKLAEERPQAFLADLAMSLVNLSVFQNELGRREESLATVKEASERYRKLAQAYSAAYLPALAICLNNLAAVQSALGRNAEALGSVQEAVEYYRRLAKMMPAVFLPQLAASLNTLASVQSGLEQWQEALSSVQEGVEIRRKFAQEQPKTGLLELALSLSNLGALLSAQGRKEEALGVLGEAVDIRRRLAAEHPQAFRSELAISLNNLGTLQSSLGRGAEALASVREAVGIRRLLAGEHPEAFRPELAVSVATLSQVQKGLGQESDAVASLFEALDIIWPFFLKLPTAFTAFTGTLVQEISTLQPQVGGVPPASWKERLETWNVMLEKAQARMH